MTIWFRAAMAAAALLVLTACEDPKKADIIEKARGVETREQLQKKLGKPTEVSKLGPVEQWTYKAKDGQVVFILTGDSVAMQAAE